MRTICLLAFVCLIVVTLEGSTHGGGKVVVPPTFKSNPYTGRTTMQAGVYNPYTGAGAGVRAASNPWTGAHGARTATHNPYTGTNVRAGYRNPYTGTTGGYRLHR
jgi:hypothetical protein